MDFVDCTLNVEGYSAGNPLESCQKEFAVFQEYGFWGEIISHQIELYFATSKMYYLYYL